MDLTFNLSNAILDCNNRFCSPALLLLFGCFKRSLRLLGIVSAYELFERLGLGVSDPGLSYISSKRVYGADGPAQGALAEAMGVQRKHVNELCKTAGP